METLTIKKTKTTPLIEFDKRSGLMKITGRSIPENSSKFYEPILKWIDKYNLEPCKQTTLKIYLEYFNTSSSKYLYELFKRLEELHNKVGENKVQVEWFYEEGVEELAETGEDYNDIINIPFDIKIYDE